MKHLIVTFKLAASAALGIDKYHEYFVIIDDTSLPPDHVRVELGSVLTDFPSRPWESIGLVEASAFVQNLCGAANSVECQWNLLVASIGEKAAGVVQLYDDVDDVYDSMRE